jgi:hypothetical protein
MLGEDARDGLVAALVLSVSSDWREMNSVKDALHDKGWKETEIEKYVRDLDREIVEQFSDFARRALEKIKSLYTAKQAQQVMDLLNSPLGVVYGEMLTIIREMSKPHRAYMEGRARDLYKGYSGNT